MQINKDSIIKAIIFYNKYRFPEAHVELIGLDEERAIVKFEGTFYETCGVNYWVEDFKYVLGDLNIKAELKEIYEPIDLDKNFRIGVFKVKLEKNMR